MNWYYVQDGDRRGPLTEPEFDALVQQGTIDGGTLVWHEGMANWQPHGEIAVAAGIPLAAPAAARPTGLSLAGTSCSRCGQAFPVDQLIHIAGANVCPNCKPFALQSLQEGVLHHDGSAERIRKEHLSHEASVKSVGILYFLGGGLILMASIVAFFGEASEALIGVFLIALAGVQIWTGTGLRKLRPWARIPCGILSGFGLLGFPLGTLINGYILYLILSKKGSIVFSEPYQRVIAATPHIKYKTSILVWILLGIVLLIIGLAVVGAIVGAATRH